MCVHRIYKDTMLQYYILTIPTCDSSTNIELVWIGDLQVWCFHAWMCVAGFARACRLRICSLIDRSSGEGFTDRFLRRRWWWCDPMCVLKPDRTWQNIQKAIADYSCLSASLYASRLDVAHWLLMIIILPQTKHERYRHLDDVQICENHIKSHFIGQTSLPDSACEQRPL